MPWPKGEARSGKPTILTVHKECKHCGETKRLKDFPIAYWRKGLKKMKSIDFRRFADNCKECTRYKNAVEADPDFPVDRRGRPPGKKKKYEYKDPDYRVKYKRRVRRRTRISCLRYLAKKGCAECGLRDPRVLEFDHIEPKKKRASIATLISQGYSWSHDKLRREIRKCRVLCANCHRKHTIEQQGYYSHDDVQAELQKILSEHGID